MSLCRCLNPTGYFPNHSHAINILSVLNITSFQLTSVTARIHKVAQGRYIACSNYCWYWLQVESWPVIVSLLKPNPRTSKMWPYLEVSLLQIQLVKGRSSWNRLRPPYSTAVCISDHGHVKIQSTLCRQTGCTDTASRQAIPRCAGHHLSSERGMSTTLQSPR